MSVSYPVACACAECKQVAEAEAMLDVHEPRQEISHDGVHWVPVPLGMVALPGDFPYVRPVYRTL